MSSEKKLTPRFEILVEGSPVGPDVVDKVVALTVRQDLAMADALEVRLGNDDLAFTDKDTFAEGKTLAIKLGYVEGDLALVGTGTIVRRECEFPERGPAQVVIVAYDKRFALKHGTYTRTWKDMKDSDIVSQLAGDAGLSVDADATPVKHPYLFQPAQTDLAFITERALANGYAAWVDRENSKLFFKKPETGKGAVAVLEWGKNLLGCRPRFTTHEQVSEVTVRGWDMVKKKELTFTAKKGDLVSSMGLGKLGVERADKAYGTRKVLEVASARSTEEVEAMAKAYMNQILHSFGEGTAMAQGENKIAPGRVVELKGVGKRASGNYFVVSTFHHYEPKGYTTHFEFLRPGEIASPPPPLKKPPAMPPPPPIQAPPAKVEFVVKNQFGEPVEGLEYVLTAPDGEKKTGKLPANGVVKEDNAKAGVYTLALKGVDPPQLKFSEGGKLPPEAGAGLA